MHRESQASRQRPSASWSHSVKLGGPPYIHSIKTEPIDQEMVTLRNYRTRRPRSLAHNTRLRLGLLNQQSLPIGASDILCLREYPAFELDSGYLTSLSNGALWFAMSKSYLVVLLNTWQKRSQFRLKHQYFECSNLVSEH